MTLDLTDQQADALAKMEAWYKIAKSPGPGVVHEINPREQFFLLDGGAGTGKTTLAVEAVNRLRPHRARYCAYTAKAASVMQQKGLTGASTLHRLLYFPVTLPDGTTHWHLDHSHIQRLDLLVIDESSMVPTNMVNDISANSTCAVLVLGDLDGQLPPVGNDQGFFNWTPDFRLTVPHRSVANSPIDRMAWLARQGSPIARHMADGDTVVIKSILDPGVWDYITSGDYTVICGKHTTRYTVTRRARQHFGFEGRTPRPGEPLICCRNNYVAGFFNGQQANVWRVVEDNPILAYFIADLYVEGEVCPGVRINRHLFNCHFDEFLRKEPDPKTQESVLMDWAYAITCHKAQGSEWPNVCVIDDQLMPHDRDFRRRWLYTAVTRASERLVVLQTGR